MKYKSQTGCSDKLESSLIWLSRGEALIIKSIWSV